MANGNGNKLSIPLQIVIMVLGITLTAVSTFYISKGDTNKCINELKLNDVAFKEKDIYLEFRIDDIKDEFKEDINEFKEYMKDVNDLKGIMLRINDKLDEMDD